MATYNNIKIVVFFDQGKMKKKTEMTFKNTLATI